MNTLRIAMLGLAGICAAHADFSYTQTRKGAAGTPVNITTKMYYKGQKMASVNPQATNILDFDAQTVTMIDHARKNYFVSKFSDLGEALRDTNVNAKVDVKQTGQKKVIGGYNASEVLITMAVDTPDAARAGMNLTMEISTWLSTDVPGTQELRAFYQKNQDRFPWTAMAGGGGSGMQKAIVEAQKQIGKMGGVPVLQVIRMKGAGGEAQTQQMRQAMAQMEAMRKQGGAQAQAAERAAAMMGGRGGAMFEVTMESTGFSTAPIPASIFTVPAGYAKK